MIRFSVVINTHNRAALLADALQGVAGLRYPDFEVVVVNGPSTDATAGVLAGWQGRIKIVDCPVANLAVSRNLGIAAAAGDVVAFIDDDAVPHPDWLTELSYGYADPRVGGVGGFTLDHTGVRFQARKNLCDRYGNAFDRPDDYDERVLNRAGSLQYPSLLGTNSSFRRTALVAVQGFDPAFAYFLDETDLCLRLVDAGWRVVYAPEALVFHQFAPSALRDVRRVPRSIHQLVASKAYFILRHGTAVCLEESGRQLAGYEAKLREDNARLLADQTIDLAHWVRLDDDLARGLADGRAAAFGGLAPRLLPAPPEDFRALAAAPARLAVLSRVPSEWVSEQLALAAAQGWVVHLLRQGDFASRSFHNNIWCHQIVGTPGAGETLAVRLDIPLETADWCAAVAQSWGDIKSFGIDVVAATLREVPALAVLDQVQLLLRDGSTEAELGAHPEWRERVLFTHFHCGRLIAAEQRALNAITAQAGPGDDILGDDVLGDDILAVLEGIHGTGI